MHIKQCIKVFLASLALVIACASQAESYARLGGGTIEFNKKEPKQTSLIIVWASWCRFCMAEVPSLKEAYEQYPKVQFIGLNVNKNPNDGVQIQSQRELPYPSISDPDLTLSDKFKVRGTPDFILLSASGEILARSQRFDETFKSALKSHASPL